MKIFGINIGRKPTKNTQANFGQAGQPYYISVNFDGEKEVGAIGPVIDYRLNHSALSARSWQAYLESEIARTVLNRYTIWIIDKGLKLQCSPAKKILESEGVKIDTEEFNDIVEARFNLWSKSKHASFNGMQSLNDISKDAFKNAKIGGDVLVVLRVVNGKLKIQLIDGAHLKSPLFHTTEKNKNRIINGVEIDENGRHLKYHIPQGLGEKTIEINAWSESTGLRMAFLVYGGKYRPNNLRGIPAITTSLETLKKLERYKEAAVGSAEERQKIAYFFEHSDISDGSNPLAENISQMISGGGDEGSISVDEQGQILANKVSTTTQKQVFNLPKGAKLNIANSTQELFFKEFYETNANIICAALGIPPNVAFSLYNDSFSASRAATKDWEHTINVERDDFKNQFYDPIFELWIHLEILNGKISAPGYMEAFKNNDSMITEAYLNNRFTGPLFPHIDPLKEVKAEREKLGSQGKHLPLTTLEQSTENLFSGDASSNIEQFAKELQLSEDVGIISIENQAIKNPLNKVTE